MLAVSRVEHANTGWVQAHQTPLRTHVTDGAEDAGLRRDSLVHGDREKTNAAPDESRTLELINHFNKEMEQWGKHLRFRYNEEAGQTYVEVVDLETQEVIISLPPEYLIELSIKLKEMIGLFLDKKL